MRGGGKVKVIGDGGCHMENAKQTGEQARTNKRRALAARSN